jgi:DNA-binding SARP family transcriptional activator
MALELRLLEQPSITRDGVPVPLSGRKPWGLLAYLLLEQRPTRREVASRLIPEANDPLAALRWLLH